MPEDKLLIIVIFVKVEYNPVQFCMVSFAQLCGHDQFYQFLTYIFQGGVWIELQSINWFSAFALTYIFIYFLRNRVQYPRWAEGFAKQSLKRRQRHWKFHVYGWWTVGLVLFTNYIAIKWFLLKIYITTVDGTVKFLIKEINKKIDWFFIENLQIHGSADRRIKNFWWKKFI